jgi:CheY-like chemotaxis protein
MPRRKKRANETVMVVDDDPLIRESLSELLDEKGYSVLKAENGRKALDVLKSIPQPPCMVVLDLAMPVVNGREFLKFRAADPALRQIPVVVVSGSLVPPMPLEGVEAFLPKPVEVDRLLAIIRRTCDQQRSP